MAVRLGVDARHATPEELGPAVRVLRDGGVVAYPTDTFYGLAVDPRDTKAVRRLFALKGRAGTSALTVVAADIDQAREVAVFDVTAARLAQRWWPGPLTIVVRARAVVSRETLAGGTTMGVRVPDHQVARALARAFGFCVTATSANRSGQRPAISADDVAAALPGVDAILDAGPAPGGEASTIVECGGAGLTLLRAGAVPWDRVLESLQ
jgi:L-threonylcarbamoyladenylate synthase